MEIYVRDKIFENAAAMGEYAMERLDESLHLFPAWARSVALAFR